MEDKKTKIAEQRRKIRESGFSKEKQDTLAMLYALGSQPANAQTNSMAMNLLQTLMQPEKSNEEQFMEAYINRELQNENPDYQTIYDLMSGKQTPENILNKTGTSALEKALKAAQEEALGMAAESQDYTELERIAGMTPEQYRDYTENFPRLNILQKLGVETQEATKAIGRGDYQFILDNLFTELGGIREKQMQDEYLQNLLNK